MRIIPRLAISTAVQDSQCLSPALVQCIRNRSLSIGHPQCIYNAPRRVPRKHSNQVVRHMPRMLDQGIRQPHRTANRRRDQVMELHLLGSTFRSVLHSQVATVAPRARSTTTRHQHRVKIDMPHSRIRAISILGHKMRHLCTMAHKHRRHVMFRL